MRLLIACLAFPLAVAAQTPAAPAKNSPPVKPSKEDAHRAEDIAKHRQMARAHDEAARCLEDGKAEKDCENRLRDMCKGIAVGQYCGMKHSH